MGRCRPAITFLAMVALIGTMRPAVAQVGGDAWGEPVNLSRTGAASQPQIVAAPDGRLQAFWWDRFDGLTTAVFDGEAWSAPAAAPLRVAVRVDEEEFILTPIDVMPAIFADGRGWAHALWIGDPAEETGATPLLRSQMAVGNTAWSTPGDLAESAVAFDIAQTPEGGLALAYVRQYHTDQFPAGVYVKTTPGGASGWSAPSTVYRSAYLRMMTAQDAHLRIAAGSGGVIHLAWEDPYAGQALYAASTDGAATWSDPEALGQPEDFAARPRAFGTSDGGSLRLWEAADMAACTLQQQQLVAGRAVTATWTLSQPVLEGLDACPQGGDVSWHQDEALLWLWGLGSSDLTLAAWDVDSAHWSDPGVFDFSFDDPQTARRVVLGDLHAALAGASLAVMGADSAGGDVWVTQAQVDALELAFAPPSPWTAPLRLSEEGVTAGWPAVALGPEGSVHVVWSRSVAPDGPGTSLAYSRWDAPTGRLSRVVEVVRATPDEEIARQPALVADDQGLLHLVWSGNSRGGILYSRARLGDATGSGGWSSPQALPMLAPIGSRPQIALDPAGGLVVAYVVPLNETRGIYVTRSANGGESWSDPAVVFDAEAAGWAMVDQPALAVAPDGGLHVAWLEGGPPETWRSRGIYYALSQDGTAWSEPYVAAEPGHEWPRLAVAGGRVHLAYGESGGRVWHRSAPLERAGEIAAWAVPAPVPGFDQVRGPFGLAPGGGGTLHLTGGGSDDTKLVHSAWDGERWAAQADVPLGPMVEGVLGARCATRPGSGLLAIVARAIVAGEGEPAPAIVMSQREIGRADLSPLPTPAPPATAETAPQATPVTAAEATDISATAVPRATPDLSAGPQGSGSSLMPLIIGGGLAGVAVVATVAASLVRRRR